MEETLIMGDVNIKMTLEELTFLEEKIRKNQDTIKDYQLIDSFLSKFLPANYLIEIMKGWGILTFEALESYRKNPSDSPKNPTKEGLVEGTLLGLIGYLKTTL